MCASLYSLGGLLFRAPSGRLVDRQDPRRALQLALVVKMMVFAAYRLVPAGNVVLLGALRFLHGVTWSYIGVCGPALLALYVDRAAIGSAYALFLGIQQIVTSSARAVSITLLDQWGATTAYAACTLETLLPIILVSCMSQLRRQPAAAPTALTADAPKPARTGGLRGFICWRLVPLCLMSSLPMMTYATESTFLPALCEERGVAYLGMLTAATGLSGLVSVAVGVLCDMVSPYLLCVVTLALNGAGLVLIAAPIPAPPWLSLCWSTLALARALTPPSPWRG